VLANADGHSATTREEISGFHGGSCLSRGDVADPGSRLEPAATVFSQAAVSNVQKDQLAMILPDE
jgi:hypothetical protein